MEKEIEEIKDKIEEFIRKYGFSFKCETICKDRDKSGLIIDPRVAISIQK